MLVADPAEVEAIARAIRSAPLAAFDLEFLAQDRLIPSLCLVQVAWLDIPGLDVPPATIVAAAPEVRLIDALATDVRPVLDALAAHPCAVAHAVRQDLAIVARLGIAMADVIDTQVMAAFAGIGDQVGLANLAGELLGVALTKDVQWTDWARRPLSEAQLAYADADVRHLPAIYARLAARLGERVAWARAESRVVADDAIAAARVTPETAWRTIGGLRGLDSRARAVVQALAAWRHRLAVDLDRPLGWVLADRTLIELARARPDAPAGVRATRGISPLARQRAAEIVEAIAEADVATVAPVAAARPSGPRAQRWTDLLVAIAQLVAEQAGISVRLLATRADAEEFARGYDERGEAGVAALPAVATWRRELLGEAWLGWLAGRLALVGDPGGPLGFRLLPRTPAG